MEAPATGDNRDGDVMGSPLYRPHATIEQNSSGLSRRELLALGALGLLGASGPALAVAAEAKGQLTWGLHVSLTPTWFDPVEAAGIISPFLMLYALHDAMVKPMPGKVLAPSLAESWSMSEDGRGYEFVLRQGAK